MEETESVAGQVRVLVVEDNEDDYVLFRELIGCLPVDRASRFAFDRAVSIAQALECLKLAPYDVIMLDLTLPDGSGFDTFEAVHDAAPQTPLVILSGLEDENLAIDLVKAGAQDYLPKNELTPALLERSVRYAIERFGAQERVDQLNSALTHEKEEVSQLQMQLIQSEKLESLGRMAAGVAHEVKNPLAMLQMGVDFFAQLPEANPSQGTVLSTMRDAIQRANRIILDMVDLSRSNDMEMTLGDLNNCFRKALTLTSHDYKIGDIEVILDLCENLPPVRIDSTKIEQIFVNLLVNAAHAMPDGGRVKVRTYAGKIDALLRDEGLRSFEHLRAGDTILVAEVRDYGPGIPEDKLSKIFDPFFTTKPTGQGTGLGLAVSRTIADLHGGMLRVKNVTPPGVRAQLLLKAAPVESVPTPSPELSLQTTG